jgi:hypothetical protein
MPAILIDAHYFLLPLGLMQPAGDRIRAGSVRCRRLCGLGLTHGLADCGGGISGGGRVEVSRTNSVVG